MVDMIAKRDEGKAIPANTPDLYMKWNIMETEWLGFEQDMDYLTFGRAP